MSSPKLTLEQRHQAQHIIGSCIDDEDYLEARIYELIDLRSKVGTSAPGTKLVAIRVEVPDDQVQTKFDEARQLFGEEGSLVTADPETLTVTVRQPR